MEERIARLESLAIRTYCHINPNCGAAMSRHTTQEEIMQYTRNFITRGQKLSKKKRNGTEQLQNVISLRLSDEEKKSLEKLTKSTSKSISEIMREAIDLWSYKRRKLCLD